MQEVLWHVKAEMLDTYTFYKGGFYFIVNYFTASLPVLLPTI